MAPRLPKHEHDWRPFSWDESGEPALWSCSTHYRCIKTVTAKERSKLIRAAERKALKEAA